MVMINFSFKKIWHITNKQTRVVQIMEVQVAEEWMVIVRHPLVLAHVHIQARKTKPGGEWTWEKWSMLLKCTLSTETSPQKIDCQSLRSELVCHHLLHHLLH